MSEQKKAPKIEDSVILSAIEKVKDKGFDINPYTVSDEAKVFPSDIFRAPHLMKIVLDARDEESKWHFQPSASEANIKFNSLEISLNKLREENERLSAHLEELEEKLTAPTSSSTVLEVVDEVKNEKNKDSSYESDVDFSLGDDFNEQFKDLLQMESESQVQELEKQLAEAREELDSAKSELARIEDDKKDLGHSVLGLERVNEALNIRMRELDAEIRELKAETEKEEPAKELADTSKVTSNTDDIEELQYLRNTQQELTERLNHFEDENARLIGRIQELENEAEQKESQTSQSASNPELEAYVVELEQRISESEAKQVELQEEMDTLVTQLQNSWHTGYQKGLSDGKAEATQEASAASEQIQIEPASINFNATAPIQSQAFQAPDLSMMQGIGNSSSEYNALKEMKWKDVETVYQMGGQGQAQPSAFYENAPAQESVFAQDQGYTQEQDYTQDSTYVQPQEEVPYDFGGAFQNYDEHETLQDDLQYNPYEQGEYDQQGEYAQEAHGEYQNNLPNQEYFEHKSQETEIDFDQMDIFEDIEELERLGRIELPDDIIPIDHSEKATPSEAELRNLVQNKIQHKQEHNTPDVPRMVGKATVDPTQAQTDPTGVKGINKFVGQRGVHANTEAALSATNLPVVRNVPPEVRKACQILGLAPETMTKETISDSWKKAITAPGVHPDQGGDTEIATSINLAKATLLKFLDQTAPKLGKKFGAQSASGVNRFAGKKKPEDQKPEDQE